jgi:hypothetical protein
LLAHACRSSGILVGMTDGSTTLLASEMEPNVWWALCTPMGGEVVNANE